MGQPGGRPDKILDQIHELFSEVRRNSRLLGSTSLATELDDVITGHRSIDKVPLPNRLREGIELFAGPQHYARFLRASLTRRVKAARAGEYLVIYSPEILRSRVDALAGSPGFAAFLDAANRQSIYEGPGLAGVQHALSSVHAVTQSWNVVTPLVVGVSRDLGKAFSVTIAPTTSVILGLTPSAVEDEFMVRQALGFDLHVWEYDWNPVVAPCGLFVEPVGIRVRLQGDLVLDLDCWIDNTEFFHEIINDYVDAAAVLEWSSRAFRRVLAGAPKILASIGESGYPSRLVREKATLMFRELIYKAMGLRAAPVVNIDEAVTSTESEDPYVFFTLTGASGRRMLRPMPITIVGPRNYAVIRVEPIHASLIEPDSGEKMVISATPAWVMTFCNTLVLSSYSDVSVLSVSGELPWMGWYPEGFPPPKAPFAALAFYETGDGGLLLAFSPTELYCLFIYVSSALASEERATELLEGFAEARSRFASNASPGPVGVRVERHEVTFRGSVFTGLLVDADYLVSRYLGAIEELKGVDGLQKLPASGSGLRRFLSRRPEAARALARALSLVASVKTGVPVAFMDSSAPLTVDHPEHGMDSYRLPMHLKARLTTVNSS